MARRHQSLTAEIKDLDTDIKRLCAETNPALLAAAGVGADTAAALLITAGDNPERMRTKSVFAALCGVSPVQASSGRIVRHRLNRGGNRQANQALWRIATTRMRWHQPTIEYVEKRRTEGKTRKEIIRCLKRHIAREIYHLLSNPHPTLHGNDLRCLRKTPEQPSTTPPKPSEPTQHASPNSNEANTTTTTSPPATTNGSPPSPTQTRFDKHRSIGAVHFAYPL